ncbi:hypothetical protein Tco_0688171 [Tanacetum coccineum]
MHEDYEYVKSLEKEVDELKSKKADFSNIYDLLLEEFKECECLAQKLSKQTESVNNENLPQNRNQAVQNTNVLKPGMYRMSLHQQQQTRTSHMLPHASRNTNPHMFKSSGVIHTTSVSRPQLKCYQVKDKVMPNNSQVKFKKKEVEDHHRIFSIPKKTKSVTAYNDSSNSRTLNENAVCAECGTCVFNSNHDACVSRYLEDVNARTKKPNVVPISASKPKRKANKSVATPHKKTVALDTTIQKSMSYYKELYENTNQEWKWWIAKRCSSGYTWTQKPLRTKKIWMPKIRKDDESISISPTIDIVSRITNIVQFILFIVDSGCTKHMTGNLKLLCNFVETFMGTVPFGNDQFALILGYGDLIQENVMIKWVYYVEGLNHNIFSVGQLCDADLEVAFRKSTCFVRDLQGNDLLTVEGYRNLQQRTRLIVESYSYQVDEFKEMMSDHNISDLAPQLTRDVCLVPQGQKASDYDNFNPVPPRQNVVPTTEKTDSSQQGLEFLFSPLLEEYYNPTHGYVEDNNND